MALDYLLGLLKGDKPKAQETLDRLCLHKIRVMQMAYVPEELIICRNCDGYDTKCPRYRSSGEICRTKGKVAMERYTM